MLFVVISLDPYPSKQKTLLLVIFSKGCNTRSPSNPYKQYLFLPALSPISFQALPHDYSEGFPSREGFPSVQMERERCIFMTRLRQMATLDQRSKIARILMNQIIFLNIIILK